VQIVDDTNIWAAGAAVQRISSSNHLLADGEQPGQQPADDQGQRTKAVTAKGKIKTNYALLGMIQRVVLRRHGAQGESEDIQLHAPGQVLPKANAYTIRARIAQWVCLSSQGCGSAVGGKELEQDFSKIPLKALVCPGCYT
jgi:hypothetical protein